jgi:hypothetical protein
VAGSLQRFTHARHGFLVTEIDSSWGEVLDTHPLAQELGDYAQYAFVFRQMFGEPELVEWARRQTSRDWTPGPDPPAS